MRRDKEFGDAGFWVANSLEELLPPLEDDEEPTDAELVAVEAEEKSLQVPPQNTQM